MHLKYARLPIRLDRATRNQFIHDPGQKMVLAPKPIIRAAASPYVGFRNVVAVADVQIEDRQSEASDEIDPRTDTRPLFD
jgi:hypothetical protein